MHPFQSILSEFGLKHSGELVKGAKRVDYYTPDHHWKSGVQVVTHYRKGEPFKFEWRGANMAGGSTDAGLRQYLERDLAAYNAQVERHRTGTGEFGPGSHNNPGAWGTIEEKREHAYNTGLKAGEASAHHDQALVTFTRDHFRRWVSLASEGDKTTQYELEKHYSEGYSEGASHRLGFRNNPKSDRFTYRGARIEIWQGNDNEGKLGYDPWFFRPLNEPTMSRVHWQVMGPSRSRQEAIELAKHAVDRALERSNPSPGWFDRCMAGVERSGSAYDPGAVCGALEKKMGYRRNPAYDWFSERATKHLDSLTDAKLKRRMELVRAQISRAFSDRNEEALSNLQNQESAIIQARMRKLDKKQSSRRRTNPEKLDPAYATHVLSRLGIPVGEDFHTLSGEKVGRLLEEAKAVGYRRSSSAPGSTARMFHQYLQRLAARKRNPEVVKPAGFKVESSGTLWYKEYTSLRAAEKKLQELLHQGYQANINFLGGKHRVRVGMDDGPHYNTSHVSIRGYKRFRLPGFEEKTARAVKFWRRKGSKARKKAARMGKNPEKRYLVTIPGAAQLTISAKSKEAAKREARGWFNDHYAGSKYITFSPQIKLINRRRNAGPMSARKTKKWLKSLGTTGRSLQMTMKGYKSHPLRTGHGTRVKFPKFPSRRNAGSGSIRKSKKRTRAMGATHYQAGPYRGHQTQFKKFRKKRNRKSVSMLVPRSPRKTIRAVERRTSSALRRYLGGGR